MTKTKKMSIYVVILVLAVLIGAGYYALMPKSPKTATDLTGDQVAALIADTNVVFLDVRTPMELRAGKIGNAVHIDYMAGGFEEKIAQLDTSKTYVVYCHSAGRSPKAFDIMKKNGFENVLHYPGGWAEWSRR
jgi:rhodanese-related sulfurtransferase